MSEGRGELSFRQYPNLFLNAYLHSLFRMPCKIPFEIFTTIRLTPSSTSTESTVFSQAFIPLFARHVQRLRHAHEKFTVEAGGFPDTSWWEEHVLAVVGSFWKSHLDDAGERTEMRVSLLSSFSCNGQTSAYAFERRLRFSLRLLLHR